MNKMMNDYYPELVDAAINGHKEIVELLIDRGADIHEKGIDGRTVMVSAAKNGQTEIVQLLLDKGANINAKDNSGTTALMWAALCGKTETVQLLIDRGANRHEKNKQGETAVDLAIRNDIFKLLGGIKTKSRFDTSYSELDNDFFKYCRL